MKGKELAEELLGLPFVQGVTGGTDYNLKAALIVEEYVSTKWFPELAKIARSEDREDIAKLLENIGKGETTHAEALREAMTKLGTN